MQISSISWLILMLAALSLAPGAAQVKITTNPADVSGCTAVGNTPS
jgi:hypothetical protein